MTRFGETWDDLHRTHGRPAIVGTTMTDEEYRQSGQNDADRIEALVGGFAGRDVLEYGAGDGRILEHVAARARRAVGCDASEVALEGLRRRVPGVEAHRVEFPRDLPEGLEFDVVYAAAVVYHLTNVQAFGVIADVYARLRPGGVFAFDLCNIRHPAYIPVLQGKIAARDWVVPWPWVPQSLDDLVYVATAVVGFREARVPAPDVVQPWIVLVR